MDEKDLQILAALREDSSLTTRQIARKTKIPITTVHNRIRKLKAEGVIKRFTIDINHKLLGKSFVAVILVSVDYKLLREVKKDQHKLAQEIGSFSEVEQVDIVTGGTDMVVRIRVKNVEEFDNFLLKKFQKIAGVDRTTSLIVIHEI